MSIIHEMYPRTIPDPNDFTISLSAYEKENLEKLLSLITAFPEFFDIVQSGDWIYQILQKLNSFSLNNFDINSLNIPINNFHVDETPIDLHIGDKITEILVNVSTVKRDKYNHLFQILSFYYNINDQYTKGKGHGYRFKKYFVNYEIYRISDTSKPLSTELNFKTEIGYNDYLVHRALHDENFKKEKNEK